MEEVHIKTRKGHVEGQVHPDFAGLCDAFVANFNERQEVGASLALVKDGEPVVDLWGGMVDEAGSAPWTQDTVSIVWSITKAATAFCAHLLVERGELDLHARVADYWPQFAAAGKEDVTVLMMLNHSVGLPAFRAPIKDNGFYDWDYMVSRLEQEEPFWEPGTRNGYHMLSFGWTVGELVRRVSGKSLGQFFADELARPLGLDFWIGLPQEVEPRVAPVILAQQDPDAPLTEFMQKVLGEPESLASLSILNSGGHAFGAQDSRAAHAAEIGGAGGISNARSVARLFTPASLGGGALFSRDSITRMSQVSVATGHDATLCLPTRFAQGFMKSMDNRHLPLGDIQSCILGAAAFGHVGAGGSIGFADPDCALAFGYTMNKMGSGLLLNPRGQSLVDAAYRALGYRTNSPGIWVP